MFAVTGVIAGLFYLALIPNAPIRFPSALVLPAGLIIIIGLQTLNGFLLYRADALFPVLTLLGFSAALILGATLAARDGCAPVSFTLAWTFIVSALLSLFCQHAANVRAAKDENFMTDSFC